MNAVTTASKQIFFDDVAVGLELPVLRKGPLTILHLVRWSAATENWRRIHYDEKYAVEQQKLPAPLVSGALKSQFVVQLLKDWAGLEGWVWKAKYQFRSMDVVGTTLDVRAKVRRTIPLADYGLVELDVTTTNSEGRESTTGVALVALPYRAGAPVPYPFVPPQSDPWAEDSR